jgi:hypothetical protein
MDQNPLLLVVEDLLAADPLLQQRQELHHLQHYQMAPLFLQLEVGQEKDFLAPFPLRQPVMADLVEEHVLAQVGLQVVQEFLVRVIMVAQGKTQLVVEEEVKVL